MIAFALLAAAEAPLTPKQCVAAQTQIEMTMCAKQEFERADAALNALWTKLIATARADDRSPDSGRTDTDTRSEEAILRKGQRAWVQFRDAECEYEGLAERGGSMEPMTVNLCLTRMTRERIKQLTAGEQQR